MSTGSHFEWRTGKEIDAQIDLRIFVAQANDYVWEKRLSIRPRRCYLTENYIRPFSYAMVAIHRKPWFIVEGTDQLGVGDDIKKTTIPRWVSMSSYIFLRLNGTLNG